MIVFDLNLAQVIGLLSGIVLPLIVGLVTTRVTHSGVKAVLLAALAFATNLLTEFGFALSQSTPYDLSAALVAGLGTFLVAVGIHYGFWKPTGTAEKVQDVGVTPK